MHGDCHVGGLGSQRGSGEPRIACRQAVGIVAAFFRLRPLVRVAQHRPGGVVELQIAAAGVIESADRSAVSIGEIVKERIEVGIDCF
jgi:hypothetical protein